MLAGVTDGLLDSSESTKVLQSSSVVSVVLGKLAGNM
jgi:hypothetical protein